MSDNRRGGQGHGNHGNHGGQGSHGGQGGQGNQGGQGQGNPPEPPPSNLGQKVDWMAFSHQDLYNMVHTGVDLNAAGAAQAEWTSVGKALTEVQELLAKALSQSQQAWTGGSADRAREALESVEKWAMNTSDHADNVARCIGDEIQHVQTAREKMPAPAPAPPLVEPVAAGGGAAPVATPQPPAVRSPLVTEPELGSPHLGARRLMADAISEPTDLSAPAGTFGFRTQPPSPFTGLESVSAPVVDAVLTADATHRQAAEVMAMFQQNSYAVDRTVPSFSPPTNPVAPPPPVPVRPLPVAPPVDGGAGGPVVVSNPSQPAPTDRGNTNPSQQGRGGGGGRGGFGGGRGPMPVPVAGGGAAPVGSVGSALSEPGARSAVGGGANPGSVTSTFQSPKAVTPHAGGMIGAAPMAAPPPVASQSGNERSRPGYLEDDDNVFGVDRKAAPPVIGL